jgi:hypothetical protein
MTPGSEPNETTRVAAPLRGVAGLTTTDTGAPGPDTVLQLSVTELGVAVRRFAACMDPVRKTSAQSAITINWRLFCCCATCVMIPGFCSLTEGMCRYDAGAVIL